MCHTQADVELALEKLPEGMEALYNRMASSIAKNPSATDKALASRILQYVTCSLRALTVAELSYALHEDTSRILDFHRSITELCGGFVVIDNGANVTMIHQTAREYLVSGNDRPFHVDRDLAHRDIFLSCMRCLMTIGLRAEVKGSQRPEFLDYAACSWSLHLTLSPLGCGRVAEILNSFLSSSWVLTWIHVLATSKQLRVLVPASRHLSKYSTVQKEHYRTHMMKQGLVESWAEDIVKIVGKFGQILRRDPESIYKQIPPFCPQKSAIYQQFGKTKDKSLVVSGLSTSDWDDSLARLSFGYGSYASSISAAGAQIAILISSGSVVLYDSTTFEEIAASPINHGERLYRMELNSAGTLLATYGYRTTKLWDVSTGTCRMSVENIVSRPQPLTMLLTNNSSVLLVGADDRSIRSLDLNQTLPTWQLIGELDEPELEGHFLNSSNYMALNKDGNLIAVAYRGHPLSAWETNGPVHIGHCWRRREEVSRGEVIEAVWHPHYPEVLGLYIEGVVFKWRPYDGDTVEVATGASRLALSRDGDLFAPGDVRGAVIVYTTSDFCLLYQLTSEEAVLGLAFSPDLNRFYDIRAYYGHAWEPNTLMRYVEQRGKGVESGSETDSLAQSITVSEWRSRRIDSITVFAGSPTGRLYCCGTEKGTVTLHHTQQGKLADLHISRSFLSIEQMSWSIDGRYLCFSDSSKKVTVMSLTASAGNSEPLMETRIELMMKHTTNGPILQLLFHPNSGQLLVFSSSTICTISLISSSVAHSLDWDRAVCKWIIHPQDPDLLIGVGSNSIRILDWNLAERQVYRFEYPGSEKLESDPENLEDHITVDQVLLAHDKKHVLVQLSGFDRSYKQKMFLHFETSTCSITTAATPGIDKSRGSLTIIPSVFPQSLSSQIDRVLSFLSYDNLVFLSRTFSICSWKLPSRPGPSLPSLPPGFSSNQRSETPMQSPTHFTHHHSNVTDKIAVDVVKPLFSLPGDWISRDCLDLCSVWGIERSLLCPRNGEVAVVRCAALF